MAKTKKKSVQVKEIIQSMPVEVPTLEKEEIKEKELYLSPSDLMALEVGGRDIVNAQLLTAVEEQNLRNLMLNAKILENNIEKQKAILESKAKEFENAKKRIHNLKQELFKKYDIKDEKFGYDSITGKIII